MLLLRRRTVGSVLGSAGETGARDRSKGRPLYSSRLVLYEKFFKRGDDCGLVGFSLKGPGLSEKDPVSPLRSPFETSPPDHRGPDPLVSDHLGPPLSPLSDGVRRTEGLGGNGAEIRS